MDPNLIPTLDPNPLPAPFWVFQWLLLVTFFLHVAAMNFMLGGGVLALAAQLGNRPYGARIFRDLAKKLPILLPATITLGIAPLLFVQVLYGQFFYTSSILVGAPWFLVLVLVTLAYYGFYYVSFRKEEGQSSQKNVMLVSVLLVLLVGLIYSNNVTLSQNPSRWGAKYFANPGGWNLNLTEPTLVPRFVHFLIAAVALGGILLVLIARANWKRDNEYARAVFQFGGKAFLYATMAQFLVGIWFLISLPREIRLLFLGHQPLATVLLTFGVAGGAAAILLMSRALRKEDVRLAAFYVPGLTAVVILSMAVMRELLRNAYLKPYFHREAFLVKTQWSVLPVFLILFVGGVILWLVMLKRYQSSTVKAH